VPRLLTLLALALGCVAFGAAPAEARAACPGAQLTPQRENLGAVRAAVLCLHNQTRAAHGLKPLRENSRLRLAARRHAAAMVARRFFAHTSPGGQTMTDRVRRSGYLRKTAGWTIGENIAWGTQWLATPAQIHGSWLRSPGHRRNILRRDFREVGIGIQLGAPLSAQPGATYAADFGRRRRG